MLPLSRNQNCPPGTPIKGTTIEDLEDVVISLWSRGVLAPPKVNIQPGGGKGTGHTDNGFAVALGTGGGTYYEKFIDVPVGGRVKSVEIQGIGNGADDVDVTVSKVLRATTTNLYAAVTWADVPGGGGGSTTIDIDEDDPDSTLAAGEVLVVHFDATTGANVVIYGITVEIDFNT